MTGDAASKGRRVTLNLRRPMLHLIPGVRPTVVIDGRGQPAQWGVGTWLVPDDEAVEITVFLFNRLWRFGEARVVLHPSDTGLSYRSPLVPLGPGRILVTSG
ncbi:hypothetical protein QE367_000650 [Microbacterium paludicola]|uniref:Uncharacterized protein n=1 Tax=Microbacterium paludicola TaxID=300019 RepID=A0ABU1HXT4_9MICO|nr:hypothetical protein [Microbacterium paludicola]MDR6166446.1 hypothetical protein [Microbacterium paludicola]